MARGAVSHDTRVIKHPGGKTGDAMTHTAIFGGGYVSGRLTYGERTVVARGTIATDTRVFENRWKKRRS